MSSSQGTTAMDVDSPAGTLKRCSSAPMINENNTGMTTSPPATSTTRDGGNFNLFCPNNPPRTRRSSYSFSPHSGGSPGGSMRLTPRINQLRQEECADVSNSRELAHEREIHHTMQISQSWEDLRCTESPKPNKMTPLHVTLPSYSNYYNSPSPPTRLSSPGFQSPTRGLKTFIQRRSASPVLRPSPLGAKRKLDEDRSDYHSSPHPKRQRLASFGGSERGGLLTTSSPLPGSLSSIGTPESISSADSPSFQFRMMDSPSPSRSTEPAIVSKHDQEMTEGPS